MESQTRLSSSGGREFSPAARLAERIARYLFGAILPGVFLSALLASATGEFHGGGLLSIPGFSLAIVALEAIFGAVLVGSWRERHHLRGFLIFPALILFLFSLFPGPRLALALGGILLGGYLTALPFRDGKYRFLFGISFALTAFLKPESAIMTAILLVLLLPALFGATILWVKAHWMLRVAMILLLPVAAIQSVRLLEQPRSVQPEPKEVSTALPSVLMANSEAARILFISERTSVLPELWSRMPFVTSVDSVRSRYRDDFHSPELWNKLRLYTGFPGKTIALFTEPYHLIYVNTLPEGNETARRGFVEKLWRLLDSRHGLLVLPASNRLLLPASAQWAALPGSNGTFVAAAQEAVTTDLELLDQRLQALLRPYGEENYIPAGLVPALYYTPAPPKLAELEAHSLPGPVAVASNFWIALVGLMGGYAVIRLYFRRFGRNSWGFGLMENGAAFALILLAAFDAMAHRELFTGLPAAMVWSCVGIALFPLRLRPAAGKILILCATLLPGLWFLPWNFFSMEPGWIIVVATVALATAAARGKLSEESGFPRSWNTTFSAVGWVAGGVIYAVLALLLPDPLLPAILIATAARFAWPLEF